VAAVLKFNVENCDLPARLLKFNDR
jgi:hypothetical protein